MSITNLGTFQLDRYQAQLLRLHEHICPRQVLGLRMGELAAQILKVPVTQQDRRLFVFVEMDGCFADGIMLTTGCSLGHRTMRLVDYGKVAATFVDTHAQPERAIRISTNMLARSHGVDVTAECTPVMRTRWHPQLATYQFMPVGELLCVQSVQLTVSMRSVISGLNVRVTCNGCGEEITNEREIVRGGMILCRRCAGESYYCCAETMMAALPQSYVQAQI